jgi:signal peptidase I
LDFSLILVLATVVTGGIWLLDAFVLRRRRLAGVAEGEPEATAKEPVIVEYARSFFPIVLLVLVVRSFLIEPFRIPSASMTPTLLVGDFIFVNKFSYGLRLPVSHTKVMDLGEPERGDVVVFRLPSDPAVNYIKRVVGLPGDVVEYRDKQIFVNGEPVPIRLDGDYEGPAYKPHYNGARVALERLGAAEHQVLLLSAGLGREGRYEVPAGHYFMMGDNRDDSRDSRFPAVGFVPEENLVGKAVRIWMNWDWKNEGLDWKRIGDRIT